MGLNIRVIDGKGRRVVLRDRKKTELELAKDTIHIMIATAQETLREEQNNGFETSPRIRVDNVFDKGLRHVKSYGKVEYHARQSFSEAILGIYDRLLALSPIGRTRYYVGTHLVLMNGKTVARDTGELAAWLKIAQFTAKDTMHFVNPMPYARRLELDSGRRLVAGKRKGKKPVKLDVKKPSGAYITAYRFARNKYPVLKDGMKFQFISGGVLGLDNTPIRARQPSGAEFRTRFIGGSKRPYLYPTISIKFGTGVLQ